MATSTTQQHQDGLVGLLERIAEDVGRLRTHTAYTGSLEHTINRLAAAAEDAYWWLQPTAADLYIDHLVDGLGADAALERALRDTDRLADRLLRTLRDDLREERRVAGLHELRSVA